MALKSLTLTVAEAEFIAEIFAQVPIHVSMKNPAKLRLAAIVGEKLKPYEPKTPQVTALPIGTNGAEPRPVVPDR